MPLYLFDTNAIGHMMADDQAYESRMGRIGERGAISVVSRGEIEYGLARLPVGQRRDTLAAKAKKIFAALDALLVTTLVADEYGRLRGELETQGISCSDNDLWIAATCSTESAILVSRDLVFQKIPGLNVEVW